MIVISSDIIKRVLGSTKAVQIGFSRWDDGDVYNLFHFNNTDGYTPGTITMMAADGKKVDPSTGNDDDEVRVLILQKCSQFIQSDNSYELRGFVRQNGAWKPSPVQEIPVKDKIFSRLGGLLETDAIADKRVAIFGLGSGGSPIAIKLAKSGVFNFDFMEHDRLEVGNVTRHVAGISHVGRYKTHSMTDLIKEKNPYAVLRTWEEPVSWDNIDTVRKIIRRADIVICAVDQRPPKLIINRICVEENIPCIFAGAFRRAYGGQILFVRPHKTLCYQCFLMSLPDQANDQEIASRELAEGLAYTDRPVAIEPGLSNDIAPISQMVVKLVIQELLKGSSSTLSSLDEDLVAPWYLWLNRREADSPYADLEPLEFNIDGMHVLRWYGIAVEPHPACPVCGDFEGQMK